MTTRNAPKRVAFLGFALESNAFAPVTPREEFLAKLYLEGEAILEEMQSPQSRMKPEVIGFCQAMDDAIPWTPVPIVIAEVEAGGPADHRFFIETMEEIRHRLLAALPFDGVYVANHGAALTTESLDPDGELLAMIRDIVGPTVPVVLTLDLHANVSEAVVRLPDVVIGYRTNPHVDMLDRGAEAAHAMLELFAGTRPQKAFMRLPLIAPTVSQLTASGPLGDLIEYGQANQTDAILNVTVLGGFAFADTPKNGLSIIVTARGDATAARTLVRDMATRAWADRERYVPRLTPLDEATRLAVEVGDNPARKPVIFADVADNPGGGGRGNTAWILESFLKAGARNVLMGLVYDPALAREAHERGEGAAFCARLNREETARFSDPFEAPARVLRLTDGQAVGRRGQYVGRVFDLGPCALLEVGGVKIVVTTLRVQCGDPIFFEMMGLDIAAARSVVVKSRGHFRAGFDQFFAPEQIIEVDAPGLTSPILTRFDFRRLPRPVFPLDRDTTWQLPEADEYSDGQPQSDKGGPG